MTKRFSTVVPVLCLAAVLTLPTAAHHSFGAEYDVNQPITVTGVLTKVEWTNPHTHIDPHRPETPPSQRTTDNIYTRRTTPSVPPTRGRV